MPTTNPKAGMPRAQVSPYLIIQVGALYWGIVALICELNSTEGIVEALQGILWGVLPKPERWIKAKTVLLCVVNR